MSQKKSWIIFIAVYFIVFQFASFVLAKPREGLVGHWSFNEGTGKVASDSSPEKNDGELWGDVKWAKEGIAKPRSQGISLEFPLNAGVNVPAQGVESLEEITEAITISAWIKITGAPTDDQGNIVVKAGSYYLVYRDEKLGMYLYGPSDDGGLGYQTGKTKLPLKKWMHVALTYDRNEIILYFDGEVDVKTKAKEAIKTRNNEAFIGIGLERLTSRFFQGFIDEVMLYANVSLSQDEIKKDLIQKVLSVEKKDKVAMTWGGIKIKG
ncbi:LamG domain-containing protein [Candidatus Poribacteria bacterium]|nr:LamG domain-containing protein [Candidatus Poribacteria bacterium]